MKYLIFQDFGGNPVCFLFPNKVNHADMRDQLPYGQILAAGYVEMQGKAFRCFGHCAELAVASRPEDAQLITEAFAPQA